ncbi:unnamed protein product [Alternaria alternata]
MKKLCFTDDFFGDAWGAEELTSVLNDFVEGDWGASAPQLQQIYVAIDREWLGEAEDDCLRKLCEENGLRFRGKNAEAETIRDVNAVAVGAKRSAGYRHHDDEDDVHAASGAGPCR